PIATLLIYLEIALGYHITRFIDPEGRLTRLETFFASVVLGLTSSTFILLAFLLTLRSWGVSIPLLYAVLAISGVTLLWRLYRAGLSEGLTLRPRIASSHILLTLLLALYVALALGVLFVDARGIPSAILKGWGDSAYHLDMISLLKTADPFRLEQPNASGTPLTYPFLINLQSALYERVGFPLFFAWHTPILLYGSSFFFLLWSLGKRVVGEDTVAVAFLALVLFGGGIGFLWFLKDLWAALEAGGFREAAHTFLNPPHEYTHLDMRTSGKPKEMESPVNIVWIVPAISFLTHQRSFPAGASLAALVLIGTIAYRGRKPLWRLGFAWGMIPLAHTHTFLALTIILALFFIYDLKNWSSWIKASLAGGAIALPQVLYITSGLGLGEMNHILKPHLGWLMCTHDTSWLRCDPGVEGVDTNPLWFWTKNFGAVFWMWLFCLIAPLLLKGKRMDGFLKSAKPFVPPSLALFILPNLVLFQPWAFDNNKILYYWWWLGSLLSCLFLWNLLPKGTLRATALSVFVAIAILSGIIDATARVGHFTKDHFPLYRPEDLTSAKWIRENTHPSDAFLTGDNPSQFVPKLTGRPIFLGYPGWLWSQGKRQIVEVRKEAATRYLSTGDPTAICPYGARYVVWDRELVRTYPTANKQHVLRSTTLVYAERHADGDREILKIDCPSTKR
ncbi:MAG: hypothetical protein QXI19_13285, partial [Candidatus Caldarchaeum sp.]